MFWKKSKLSKETSRCYELLHNLRKNLTYSRDLLSAEDLATMRGFETELATALKAKRRDIDIKELKSLRGQIVKKGRKLFPASELDELGENVEIIVVAVVIALAIRSFFFQPFKIPTGSMQPTLNGVRYTDRVDEAPPFFGQRWLEAVTLGRGYHYFKTSSGGTLDEIAPGGSFLWFGWSWMRIGDESHMIWLPPGQIVSTTLTKFNRNFNAPLNKREVALLYALRSSEVLLRGMDGGNHLAWFPTAFDRRFGNEPPPEWEPGDIVYNMRSDTGDQLLVNKMIYHFRRPQRGEIFVFTTTNIPDIGPQPGTEWQTGSQYYIKRCVGTPGDRLSFSPLPQQSKLPIELSGAQPGFALKVNGEVIREPSAFDKIYSLEDGYHGYAADNFVTLNDSMRYMVPPGQVAVVPPDNYWALGDNSLNSKDSRYWGGVPRENLVGTATFVYYPFSSHWGLIW